MKFISVSFFFIALSLSVYSFPLTKRAIDPALIPEFGHPAGLNPTGTGDCDGIKNAAGVVVKIPCFCPPDRASFIKALNENVARGKAVNNTAVSVSFPTDNSKASQIARITASLITLQNLRGPGVGCPAASTTLLAQQNAIAAGSDNSTPTAVTPAPPPSATPTPVKDQSPDNNVKLVDASLVPDFGHPAGLNPTGTGDCDGIENAAGDAIKVPCFCPPDRTNFIKALSENVALGRAVNNTGVQISFPTDNSNASKSARITACLITLQNLKGPGVGCPAASTTLLAQQKAIAAGSDDTANKDNTHNTNSGAPTNNDAPSSNPDVPLVDASLVPEFGHPAGLNPSGTGDCDGIPSPATGIPIKVPCSCPPDRTSFIQKLSANVAKGEAIDNPSLKLSFPTDGSRQSQLARMHATLVTLQNLNGPGKGCPASSTTLLAQQKAI